MMRKALLTLLGVMIVGVAYATITTINFDATVDTNINAYTVGGAAFSYVIGTGGNMTVSAADDNVLCTGFTGAEYIARYTGTGTTTGDQDVKANVKIKNFNYGGVGARFSAVADTGYLALINTNDTNEVQLYERVAGVLGTPLGTWDDGITAGSTVTIRLRVVTNGANADWQVQVNSGTTHTGTDTTPLAAGQPAIYCNTDEQFVTIDTLVIDTLSSSASVPAIYHHTRQMKQ